MTTAIDTNSTDWPQRLLNVLRQQGELVRRLDALAQRQGDLIRDGRTEALLEVLAERQQIIDRFLATQGDYADVAENLEDRLADVDEPKRSQIRMLVGEISDALDAVMQRDEQDRGLLQKARDETKNELAGLGFARQARQAYLHAAGNSARFADRQG